MDPDRLRRLRALAVHAVAGLLVLASLGTSVLSLLKVDPSWNREQLAEIRRLERELDEIRSLLPERSKLGFVGDPARVARFQAARYTIAPHRLVRGAGPPRVLVDSTFEGRAEAYSREHGYAVLHMGEELTLVERDEP